MNRIFHPWYKWECYKFGFYETTPPRGMSKEQAINAYKDFLANITLFEMTLNKVIVEWKYSCEHYLTNVNMNRIAWLGQASMVYHTGVSSNFRTGYNLLNDVQKEQADKKAFEYLNKWLCRNDFDIIKWEER